MVTSNIMVFIGITVLAHYAVADLTAATVAELFEENTTVINLFKDIKTITDSIESKTVTDLFEENRTVTDLNEENKTLSDVPKENNTALLNPKRILYVNAVKPGKKTIQQRANSLRDEITSLLYEESVDGDTINEVWMYSLGDVADFFKNFLNIDICEEKC